MFFRKQIRLGIWLSSVLTLLMIVVFSVNTTNAQQLDANVEVNPRNLDERATDKAYNALSITAIHAFMKHLTDPTDPELLETLVTMSNDFINTYPSSEQIDAVYYYLGRASVQLGRIETGITVLEKLIKDSTPDRIVVTHYPDRMWDKLRWSPLERGLLELGLAHDKHNQHDKADAVYRKLITHPKFAGGLQARIARRMLELGSVLRTGEIPKVHNAWIGQQAPNFWLEDMTSKWHALHLCWGQVVLLYFGASDTPILKQVHEKYKDQRFQIININVDPLNPSVLDAADNEETTRIHTQVSVAKLVDMYQVRALPAVFLIDSEGVIRKTHLTGAALEKAVDELVTENLATYADPRTKEIIAAAVAAHGGLEKLQVVKNIVMNYRVFRRRSDSSIEEGKRGKSVFYRDKLRIEAYTDNAEEASTFLFDGTSIYTSKGEKFEQMSPAEAKSQIEIHKDVLFRQPMWLLPTLAQNEIPVQYLGTKNVKGAPASVLRVKQPSGKPIKIFISQKTNYVVQLQFEVEVADGPENTVISLEQYKDVDGIQFVHHWIEKHKWQNEIFFTEVTLNAEIDPELFSPKSSTKMLLSSDVRFENPAENTDAENTDPKAEDIVSKAVAAHGGREKLIAVKNMVRDYQLFQGRPDGSLQMYGGGKAYLYPDKYRSDFYTTKNEQYTILSDGEAIYIGVGDTFQRMPAEQEKAQIKGDKDMAFREPIWLLKTLAQNKVPVQYVGTENVKDGTASVLRVKQPSGASLKIFISDKTHYLVQLEIEGEQMNVLKIFGQYKDVDGIMLPYQSITKDNSHHESHFSNVIINAEIDPELFNPKE